VVLGGRVSRCFDAEPYGQSKPSTLFTNQTTHRPTHPPTLPPLPRSLCFILLKGAKKVISLPVGTSLWICAVAGVGAAIIGGAVGMPLLFKARKRWDAEVEDQEAQGKNIADVHLSRSAKSGTGLPNFLKTIEVDKDDNSVSAWLKRARNAATSGINADVFECIGEDDGLHAIHASAERFDPRAEQVFKYLQVISAAAVSFAHGANGALVMDGRCVLRGWQGRGVCEHCSIHGALHHQPNHATPLPPPHARTHPHKKTSPTPSAPLPRSTACTRRARSARSRRWSRGCSAASARRASSSASRRGAGASCEALRVWGGGGCFLFVCARSEAPVPVRVFGSVASWRCLSCAPTSCFTHTLLSTYNQNHAPNQMHAGACSASR
jgi:phosphate/sulfate permease